MYYISIYSHFVVIAIICLFGSKDFTEESTFLVLMYFLFLWLICFVFISCLLLYFVHLWVEAVFFSRPDGVATEPREMLLKLQKRQNRM